MIPQRNISVLANRLAQAGGRRIPELVLERDYCLAWFLIGLSQSPLRQQLIFKGGTALKRCYFAQYRFSEDLDFTLAEPLSLPEIVDQLTDVYATVRNESGIQFRFLREDRRQHRNSHTFYLGYEGPLPSVRAKAVKVDMTIREKIVCPLAEPCILRGYEEYSDLPEGHSLLAYSLQEIVVEKLIAVSDRARNEPRDIYDLWFLLSGNHVDVALLQPELDEKLAFRNRDRGGVYDVLLSKEARLKRLWDTRLAAQMSALPAFDDVFRSLVRIVRESGILAGA